MEAKNSVRAGQADLELDISRIFDAPRALVWKAWTESEHLARWWGPRGFTLPNCKLELRTGGAYRFQMRGPDGATIIGRKGPFARSFHRSGS